MVFLQKNNIFEENNTNESAGNNNVCIQVGHKRQYACVQTEEHNPVQFDYTHIGVLFSAFAAGNASNSKFPTAGQFGTTYFPATCSYIVPQFERKG